MFQKVKKLTDEKEERMGEEQRDKKAVQDAIAVKQSAMTKLAAIGLTPDEIKAIIGA